MTTRATCDRTSALFAALVGAAAIAASCAKQSATQMAMPPTPVEIAVATQGRVTDRFEAVGTIEAGEEITVVAEIDGVVTSLPFREGAPIAKGGVIAQLDDVQLRAEVSRTEALRDRSQSMHDRVKSIVDQGAGAPQDLDDAASALKVAEANLALARARLTKTRIVAPWDGIAGSRRVSPGAFLRPGDPITTLAAIGELRVTLSAPERYLSSLKRGAAVTVTTTAYPDTAFEGTIDVIEPVLDAATRSARIVARVANPGGLFRPGMSANVSAVLSARENAMTVPSEAIFVEGDQPFVYVVKADSSVARAPLSLGTRLAGAVEVLSGLEPGARVVRAGHQKLYDGAKVAPVISQDAGGAPAAGATEPEPK